MKIFILWQWSDNDKESLEKERVKILSSEKFNVHLGMTLESLLQLTLPDERQVAPGDTVYWWKLLG